MSIQLPTCMDKADFIAWAEKRGGRYELANRHIVMMSGPTVGHAMITANLLSILRGQLDKKAWQVFLSFGVDTGPESLRCPDVVVDRAGGRGGDVTATAPTPLVEILSPSSATIDLNDKTAEYLKLPSLLAYLVFDQGAPKSWVWTREEDGFSSEPDVISGYDKIIYIRALHLMLPIGAIYAGVDP